MAAVAWIRRDLIEEKGREGWTEWRTWLDKPPAYVSPSAAIWLLAHALVTGVTPVAPSADPNDPSPQEAAMLAAWQSGRHGVIEG